MREKILGTIENSNKALNPIDIMNKIKSNNNVKDYEELILEIEKLCQDGLIRLTNGNGYVKNELLYGVIDVHEKGSAHLLVKDNEDLYISKYNLNSAHDKDTVLVSYINKDHNEGRVVRVLKRSLGRALGEVINTNGIFTVKMLDDLPYKVEVEKTDLNLVDGLIVHLNYVKDLAKGKVLAKIDYIIGHKNAAGSETQINMIASEFGRRLDFPQEVLLEAKKFKTTLSSKEVIEAIKSGRVDLRGETIITIDGKDTKDIDDAINTQILPNGNYLQTVAIADVSHYVKMGSEIWKYAEFKGNSDYLGNKVGPMLPIELSNGICSLNPNEDRFAVCIQYELNHSGEILNPNVFLSVIKSKQKMNYDAVEDMIKGKETENTKDYKVLKYTVKENETLDGIAFKYGITSFELMKYNTKTDIKEKCEINIPTKKVIINNYISSKIMKSALKRRGKIDFDSKERKYEFDKNDNVIGIMPRIQREAEELIENMMIYANEAFASFMINKLSEIFVKLIPFVYRTHGSPNPKKLEDFLNMLNVYGISLPFNINVENVSSHDIEMILESLKNKSNYSAFSNKLLRCMQKAKYTPDNYGHFALGSNLYCHFTSPIRRMADLIVHTMFKIFVIDKKHDIETLRFWANYLDKICEQISLCEQDAEKCEYAVEDYLNATFMQNNLGEIFVSTVDGLLTTSFFARTDNFIDGRVDFYLEPNDAKELLNLKTKEERIAYVELHKKSFIKSYDYNEKLYGFQRNSKMYLRYGDRIKVICTGAYPERREIDFTLVGKI